METSALRRTEVKELWMWPKASWEPEGRMVPRNPPQVKSHLHLPAPVHTHLPNYHLAQTAGGSSCSQSCLNLSPDAQGHRGPGQAVPLPRGWMWQRTKGQLGTQTQTRVP